MTKQTRLTTKQLAQLAQNYLAYYQAAKAEKESVFEYWLNIQEIVKGGGQNALKLLESLCLVSNDLGFLSFVGAGPLESFLSQYGRKFHLQIEELAKSNDNFIIALHAVWRNDMNDKLWSWILSLRKIHYQRVGTVK